MIVGRGWRRAGIVGLLCLGLAACAPAPLTVPPPAPEFDHAHDALALQDEAALAAVNPDAVPIFRAANEALYDQGQRLAAETGFKLVLTLAPEFGPALRKLSYVAWNRLDYDEAVEYAERAVAADPSGPNHSALAWAYLYRDTAKSNLDAYDEAQKALLTQPDDPDTLLAWYYAAVRLNNVDELKEASARALAAAPWSAQVHFVTGQVANFTGQYELSEQELLLAKRMGANRQEVEDYINKWHVTSLAQSVRWLRREGYLLVGWLALFVVLSLVGASLNRTMLRQVQDALERGALPPGGGVQRAAYRFVLQLATAYFYLTVPLVLLLVVAVIAEMVGLAPALGEGLLPFALVGGVVLVPVLLSIARGLWQWAKRHPEPGRPLARAEAPQLWAMAEDVARRLKTHPVTAIYVAPTTELVVLEGGSLWQRLIGAGPRYLLLGLGYCPALTAGQVRALIAQGYGLLAEGDSAGGRLVVQMRLALGSLVNRMSQSGKFKRLDPAWRYVSDYRLWFLRLALGAFRWQVLLADRAAALLFGRDVYQRALESAARQDLVFDEQIKFAQRRLRDLQWAVPNLYTQPPDLPSEVRQKIETRLDEIRQSGISPTAYYPALGGRQRLVQGLAAIMLVDNDARSAWDLLADPAQLQEAMLVKIRNFVQQA